MLFPHRTPEERLDILRCLKMIAESPDPQAKEWLEGKVYIVVWRNGDEYGSRAVRYDNQTERFTPKYRLWRSRVFVRDNYTCRDCGARGNLVAHHIKEWAEFPALRFEIDNGLTLCNACHAERHPHLKRLIKRGK